MAEKEGLIRIKASNTEEKKGTDPKTRSVPFVVPDT
jgi:hypothetical protein